VVAWHYWSSILQIFIGVFLLLIVAAIFWWAFSYFHSDEENDEYNDEEDEEDVSLAVKGFIAVFCLCLFLAGTFVSLNGTYHLIKVSVAPRLVVLDTLLGSQR
jgi:Ca2+/Na+ antiporter